jgi:Zn-dependent metalloprotease
VERGASGRARFLAADPDEPVTLPRGRGRGPALALKAHLRRFGDAFGIEDPSDQLRTVEVEDLPGDRSAVRLQQLADGLPVLGGELSGVVDDAGNLLSVQGETSASVRTSRFDVPASRAAAVARATTAEAHGRPAGRLVASAPVRWLYDQSLLQPGPAGARAVWRVEVTDPRRADVRELVLVDGATGQVRLQVDQVPRLARAVCDQANRRTESYRCKRGRYIRTERSRTSSVPEAERAFRNMGRAADFFADNLGVDLTRLIGSDTGDGRKLRSTVRVCFRYETCPYPNAFWDGRQTVLGRGFAGADDVVAHEMTHGVIERTADLVYWYQSGAINESMADVFGELVDQTHRGPPGDVDDDEAWWLGEDLYFGPTRSMSRPRDYGQPDRVGGPRWTTAARYADNGGVHRNSGPGNRAAYLVATGATVDGTRVPGLGPRKTARIYWSTLNSLTSAADYADLHAVLPQACRELAADEAVDFGPGAILEQDCALVQHAVDVTGMADGADPAPPRDVVVRGLRGKARISWTAPSSWRSEAGRSYVLTVEPKVFGSSSFVIDDPRTRVAVLEGMRDGRTYTLGLAAVTSQGVSPVVSRTLRGTRVRSSAPGTIRHGGAVSVRGTVLDTDGKALAGRTVQLQRRAGGTGSWRPVASRRTGTAGDVRFRVAPRRETSFRVLFPARSTVLMGSLGPTEPVRVRVRVGGSFTDPDIRRGQATVFRGTVAPDRSGARAALQQRFDGKWRTVDRTRISASDRYRFEVRPRSRRDRDWRVRVAGSSAQGLAAGWTPARRLVVR